MLWLSHTYRESRMNRCSRSGIGYWLVRLRSISRRILSAISIPRQLKRPAGTCIPRSSERQLLCGHCRRIEDVSAHAGSDSTRSRNTQRLYWLVLREFRPDILSAKDGKRTGSVALDCARPPHFAGRWAVSIFLLLCLILETS